MGAALAGIDVIGKGKQQLIVAVVILHGDLGHIIPTVALHIDDILVQRLQPAPLVDKLHKGADAALVAHRIGGAVGGAPVGDGHPHARIEERLFPQAGMQRFVIEHQLLEDLAIRLKGDAGAGFIGIPDDLKIALGHTAGEFLPVDMLAVFDLDDEPLRKGIDHRSAHAVQAARDLVALPAEFTAGVQDGIDHRHRRDAHFGVDAHGDAAAVIGDTDDIPLQYFGFDVGTVACQRLINGVIHYLIHQVVQAARPGGADIHSRALADGLQTLQHLDLCFVIVALFYLFDVAHSISYSQDRWDQIGRSNKVPPPAGDI